MIKNNGIQKIKSMELPISITPEVRTHSCYALPQCIIMAEDRIGKRIAEFEIVDTDGDNWTSIGIKKDGSQWIYESEDKYNRFCNGCIYRPLSCNEGYVHIKINFQQESEPWAAINVFQRSNIWFWRNAFKTSKIFTYFRNGGSFGCG